MPLLTLCLLVFSWCAVADDVTPYVPPTLVPWIPWVLHDDPAPLCPTRFDQATRICVWANPLRLELTEQGGRFQQEWQVLYRSFLTLPGDGRDWPEEVTLNGQPAVVLDRDHRPVISVEAGTYQVTGRFVWAHLPERLKLPAGVRLLQVSVAGQVIPVPQQDDDYLWLRSAIPETDAASTTDRLEIQVFRRLQDGQPFLLTTHLTLDVAGHEREVKLPAPLPATALPLALRSSLPASLDASGALRVQLRPGHWELEVDGRFPGLLESLTVPSQPTPWPGQEIWIFQADPNLRLVDPSGLTTLDPQQTHLPATWRHFPAFLAQPGQTLTLTTLQRGNANPKPDRLQLDRTLWWDFDGAGLTVVDHLTGDLSQDGRLTTPNLPLGQVSLAGQPQFVTRLPNDPEGNRPGIEVRRGPLDLRTESRWVLPADVHTSSASQGALTASFFGVALTLPANGWDRDVRVSHTTLALGPGWSLFAAFDMDNLPPTWAGRWSLLDLFLVLITLIAIGRIYGTGWMVPAGFALVLSWHLPEAPQLGWINLLGATALLRALPDGRLAVWVQRYRLISAVIVGMLLLGATFQSVRTILYPQLEYDGGMVTFPLHTEATPATVPTPLMSMDTSEADSANKAGQPNAEADPRTTAHSARTMPSRTPLPTLDPGAKIQTGPGTPGWHWRTLHFSWSGPVSQDQTYTLWLFDPQVTRWWRLAQCLGALFLAWVVFAGFRTSPQVPPTSPPSVTITPPPQGMAALLLIAVLGSVVGGALWSPPLIAGPTSIRPTPEDTASGASAAVSFPSPELLKELHARLTAPPRCLPNCAQLDRLEVSTRGIEANGTELSLELTLNAQILTAIPLPVDPRRWQPTTLWQDGQPLAPSSHWQAGMLWQMVPAGQHVLVLRGPLVGTKLALPLPLKPHRLRVTTPGWQVDGVGPDGMPGEQLVLHRQYDAQPSAAAPDTTPSLPLFVKVQRTLKLGLDWEVDTQVRRLSPEDVGVSLRLPLLSGEAVQTPGFTVTDGFIEVSLPAGHHEAYWRSRLTLSDHLTLTAPQQPEWLEVWRLEASPLWHTELRGLAPIDAREGSQRYPVWQPFPGEQVEISVSRPLGVSGATLTLDGARLQLKPGQQLTEATLTLTLHSSQGGQHIIDLPPGAEVLRTRVDGKEQRLRQEPGRLILPLSPAERCYEVTWQTHAGLTSRYASPVVDMGRPGVNAQIELQLPPDRWLLWVSGPTLGPAVLFWGLLVVTLLAAWFLGHSRYTPIATHQWALLGVGLSQLDPVSALGVAALPFALAKRGRLDPDALSPRRFRWLQLGLVMLTLGAVIALVRAVTGGLLGIPDMAVSGNGSFAGHLQWYADHFAGPLPVVMVISLPLWCYRLVMLVWALWLALALLHWTPWAWHCWSSGGYWRSNPLRHSWWRRRYGRNTDVTRIPPGGHR